LFSQTFSTTQLQLFFQISTSPVPLILDRIVKTVNEKVSQGAPLQRAIYKLAYDYKLTWNRLGLTTPMVDALIFKKIAKVMGGRMRVLISGGAPLSPDTHEAIRVILCVAISQGYGLTETTGANYKYNKIIVKFTKL
jgi:long-chain acyl-CoA synthetase